MFAVVSAHQPTLALIKFCCAGLTLAAAMGMVLVTSNPAHAQLSFANATENRLIGSVNSETWGVAVGDMEGDYWPDIFVGNHRNRPSLYQNDGKGKLVNNILQRDTRASWLGDRFADKHGAAWSDFDNDGDDDLMSGTNARSYQTLNIYNRSTGALKDAARTRLRQDTDTFFSMWFDFNRDGYSDLFQGRRGRGVSLYFRQLARRPGSFQRATSFPGCEADWAFVSDINDDRVSDFICAGVQKFPVGAFELRNGRFRDITSSLPTSTFVMDAVAADLDNNLKSDLVFVRGVTNSNDAVQHSPRLIEISTQQNGQEQIVVSFSGGGRLTLNTWGPPATKNKTTVMGSTTVDGFTITRDRANDRWTVTRASREAAYLQIVSSEDMRNMQFDGRGFLDKPIAPEIHFRRAGVWRDKTAGSGLATPVRCRSVVAADFDNDMDQDLYMACAGNAGNVPNRLYENIGSGKFRPVANAAGAAGVTGAPVGDSAGSSESVVTGDFNNDGFVDLFVTNGNMLQPVRARVGPHEYFLNTARRAGNRNNWIELSLVGTKSAADAAGARVVAVTNGVAQLRELGSNYHRWSQSDDRVHFGLGINRNVKLRVQWPDGAIQTFRNVVANRHYRIKEGAGITRIKVRRPNGFKRAKSGDECGKANFFPDMDSGVFVFKNCKTGQWQLKTSAAFGESYRYSMLIDSDSEIVTRQTGSLESDNDLLTLIDSSTVSFSFNTANGDMDDFKFRLRPTSKSCFGTQSALPANIRVMLGAKHLPITLPIDLNTLKPCTIVQKPSLSVTDLRVTESDGIASVAVNLDPPNPRKTVTATFVTKQLDATPGRDFFGITRTLRFPPNRARVFVPVAILDDDIAEPTEHIGLRLIHVENAGIADAEGSIEIVDDD